MKRSIHILIPILLFMMIGSSTVLASGFKDVPSTHSFYEEINYLSSKSYITGFQDETFRPNDKVTRAAAATMIGRALGLDGDQVDSTFKDVPKASYASGYIDSAVDIGIIKGYTDGTFRPNDVVTRGQMAIFLARGFKLNDTINYSFTDVSPSSSAYESIMKILAAGITQGYEDYTYRPDQQLTRGQFSAFLARALEESFRVSPPEKVTWNGEWKRESHVNPGLISITPKNSNTFYFNLNVSSGAHVGWIEGYGKVNGKQAVYMDSDSSCKLTFTHKGDRIEITQNDECYSYGGVGTFFNGSYSNNTEPVTHTLFNLGIIGSESQDQDIQSLVDSDYFLLVESMQMLNYSYDSELDADVVSGYVRGLGGYMGGNIALGADGHYYVAVIASDRSINFFTTNSTYQNSLPEIFKEWMDRWNLESNVNYVYKSL
ncbi:MAG: S-layer homology domain-containing protein [Bacillota bacterium]